MLGRLYSAEFYALAGRALAPDGLMVVQAGSPFSTATAFWRTVSTIRPPGTRSRRTTCTCPPSATGASRWRAAGTPGPSPTVPADAPPLRFLNQRVLDAAAVFSGDIGPRPLEPSTLDNPRIVEDMRHGYD